MGNSRSSLQLQQENIEQISEETGFTSNQIERLWSRFTSLDKQQKGHLTREDFLRIPELAINPLGDRIVHAFFRDSSNKDEEEGGKFGGASEKEIVNFPDFVRVLAHFRPIKKNAEKNKMNSRVEKLRFAFRMYDLDGDDKISKEELLAVLTMMVGANISEDQLVSIAERTIMEADDDKDNLISFDEFCKVLERTDVEQKMSIRFLS
jgi:calcineurin B family protein 1